MNWRTGQPSRAHAGRKLYGAFTLIELILVMGILVMAVSVTAPVMARFFRGRTLNSEARRLLALTRSGQSRAVSEGIPIDLWVDTEQGHVGLAAEPSYEEQDAKAVDLALDSGLQISIAKQGLAIPAVTVGRSQQPSTVSVARARLVRANLPTIRFLPDGSISESSPQMLCLQARDGESLWVAQSRSRVNYEIRNTDK